MNKDSDSRIIFPKKIRRKKKYQDIHPDIFYQLNLNLINTNQIFTSAKVDYQC